VTPRQRHTTISTGRGSTYRGRNTVSMKPATSRNPINPNRLTLSKGKEEEALRHEDALIDFILADRLLHLFEHNKEHFARVADVAGGALVSEVVLGLRSPPKLGQSAKGTEVLLLTYSISLRRSSVYMPLCL